MGTFPTEDMELTRLLVVSDVDRSRAWYTDVLGATVVREYGGTSSVLQLLGNWLLLVTGGGPTEDKPTVTFAPPDDPDRASAELILRMPETVARPTGPSRRAVPSSWLPPSTTATRSAPSSGTPTVTVCSVGT